MTPRTVYWILKSFSLLFILHSFYQTQVLSEQKLLIADRLAISECSYCSFAITGFFSLFIRAILKKFKCQYYFCWAHWPFFEFRCQFSPFNFKFLILLFFKKLKFLRSNFINYFNIGQIEILLNLPTIKYTLESHLGFCIDSNNTKPQISIL